MIQKIKKPLIYVVAFLYCMIQPLTAKTNTALTPDQRALITKIEGFLEGMTTLQSKFIQINPDHSTRHGLLKWLRPLKLSFEYDENPFLYIVCDDNYFTQYDDDGSQSIAISNTPASILLSKNLNFIKDTTIKAIEKHDGLIHITLAALDNPEGPTLRLVFTESPFALTQWRTTDLHGQATDIILIEPQYGIIFNKSDFNLNDKQIENLKLKKTKQ